MKERLILIITVMFLSINAITYAGDSGYQGEWLMNDFYWDMNELTKPYSNLLIVFNYVNAIELYRVGSIYSLYITRVSKNEYCFQWLRELHEEEYKVLDEKWLNSAEVRQRDLMMDIIEGFILSSNPVRNLQ